MASDMATYSRVSHATSDIEVGIYGRAYIETIGSETCVPRWPPVFVTPSKLPSIRPRPLCVANIDIPKRKPESTGVYFDLIETAAPRT